MRRGFARLTVLFNLWAAGAALLAAARPPAINGSAGSELAALGALRAE